MQTRGALLEAAGSEPHIGRVLGANFAAGMLAGGIAAAATCPLDVVKTWRQIERDPAKAMSMSLRQTFYRNLAKTEEECVGYSQELGSALVALHLQQELWFHSMRLSNMSFTEMTEHDERRPTPDLRASSLSRLQKDLLNRHLAS